MSPTRQRRVRRRRGDGAGPAAPAPTVAAPGPRAAPPAPAAVQPARADGLSLTDDVLALYAGALYAVVRADGRVGGEEGDAVRAVVRRRFGVDVDPEGLFFARITPETLAAALTPAEAFRSSGQVEPRRLARAFLEDAVAVVSSTEGLDEATAGIILRYARALGATPSDVQAAAPTLRAWAPA